MSDVRQVPETVTFDDFQEAVKPLLTLLGVTADEVLCDLHITDAGGEHEATNRIDFQLVARRAGDTSEFPAGTTLESAPQPNTELVWPCTVRVVL